MSTEMQLAKISIAELDKSNQNILTKGQLQLMLQPTPKKFIKQRPAKGGGIWNYVSGSYVKKMLNLVFGFNWDFKILKHEFDLNIRQAYVLGELTVRIPAHNIVIVKQQFGKVDIKFLKSKPNQPMDIGNDLKSASTDALKKCATELGFFQDVYNPDDYTGIEVVTNEDKELIKEERKTKRLKQFLDSATTLEQVTEIERQFLDGNDNLISPEQSKLIDDAYGKFKND